MNYLVMKALFQLMIDKSHREFIKAIISIETDVEDEDQLNRLYDFYMEDDDMSLLNYCPKDCRLHPAKIISLADVTHGSKNVATFHKKITKKILGNSFCSCLYWFTTSYLI